jgi:hypothetical protein
MVSGKVDILQQLACFLHAGVQLIILIVLVELIESFVASFMELGLLVSVCESHGTSQVKHET